VTDHPTTSQAPPDLKGLRTLVPAMLIAGVGPVLVRESPVGPGGTAFWRLAIALPFAAWIARGHWRLGRRDLGLALLSGLLLAADLVFWNNAILRTSVMEATILVMIFPILVAIAEYVIFRRRLGTKLIAGALIAFCGTVLLALSGGGGRSDVTGDLMALAAAFLYAGSLLISAELCKRCSTHSVTLWVIVGAMFGALPAGLLGSPFLAQSAFGWAYLVTYGLLTFASYALYNAALSTLPTTLVAISGYGQPVIATVLAALLLNEMPSGMDLLGAFIIVAGLIVATAPRLRWARSGPPDP
jgi:drug/metabolite transporter (DMT)-like permease